MGEEGVAVECGGAEGVAVECVGEEGVGVTKRQSEMMTVALALRNRFSSKPPARSRGVSTIAW